MFSSILDSVISSTVGRYGAGVAPTRPTVLSERHAPTDNRCANIAYANGRTSMFSTLKAPWHGLGTVISEACNSAEALKFANLADWNLAKLQCYVDFQDAAGLARKIECDRFAVVRQDTGAVLGTVGSRYEIVPNEACFDFLDEVIGPGGARYETAGALGNGERVWLLAKFPGAVEVASGDTLEKFAMLATSHDGSLAVKVFPTVVRTVCQNTFSAALSLATRTGISIRHTNNVKLNIKAAQRALGLASAACDQFADTARELVAKPMQNPRPYFGLILDDIVDVTVADQQVTQAGLDGGEILKAILAIDNVSERAKAREQLEDCQKKRKTTLDDILDRYESERCNGNPAIAGTAWAAVNAVSEFADHSPLVRYKGSDRARSENRMMSIIDGRAQELTATAVEVAMKL